MMSTGEAHVRKRRTVDRRRGATQVACATPVRSLGLVTDGRLPHDLHPDLLSHDDVLHLQRSAGNRATTALIKERYRRPEILGPDTESLTLGPSKWFPDLPDEVRVEADFPYIKRLAADMHKPADYSRKVKSVFGSYEAYLAFAPESDAELDTRINKRGKTLRSLVEHRKEGTRTQNVFYRWVRWEYVKLGVDPVATIVHGMTPELRRRLDAAGEALGITIQAGGFNPRPKKSAAMKIRLGSLSEHATGNAVDIDDKHNLIVSNEAWAFILRTTGVGAIDHSPERWNSDPGGLFDDIARVSQAWREKAASMVADARWPSRMAGRFAFKLDRRELRRPSILKDTGSGASGLKLARPPLLDDSSTTDTQLILGALASVPAMTDDEKVQSLGGLMNHSRELVLELRKQGLLWGATFSNSAAARRGGSALACGSVEALADVPVP